MNDLVRREDVLEYMLTNMNWTDEDGCHIEDYEERKKIFEEFLSGIPSTQQWISCSERLPEIGEHHISETCIVCSSDGAYSFAELKETIFGQYVWSCDELIEEVVAWMPLPEPYEEKANEIN